MKYMNEIEKAIKVVCEDTCKECYFPKKRKCTNCIKENAKKIKKYINNLEKKELLMENQIDLMAEYIYNSQIECNVYYKDKEEVKNKFAKM